MPVKLQKTSLLLVERRAAQKSTTISFQKMLSSIKAEIERRGNKQINALAKPTCFFIYYKTKIPKMHGTVPISSKSSSSSAYHPTSRTSSMDSLTYHCCDVAGIHFKSDEGSGLMEPCPMRFTCSAVHCNCDYTRGTLLSQKIKISLG